jgi:curved DNA-binding protein
MEDYYKLLGVERTASAEDIKKAYRNLARKFHPDRNPGDKDAESRFKQINEAYEVLSDSEKRAKYDQLGTGYQNWQRAGGNANTNWGGDYNFDQPGGGFQDIFSQFFGGNRARETYKQPIRGRDLEQPIEITLEEAYHGTERVLNRANKRRTIRIPAGAREGIKIRVAGEGESGYAGGQQGDLYLVVTVKPHPNYEVRGEDLHTELKIPLFTAVLGGEVVVTTLSGDVKLRIPAGTQSGQTFRISGRGMPNPKQAEERGNLFARVMIQIPTNLSGQEMALFEQLAAMRAGQN